MNAIAFDAGTLLDAARDFTVAVEASQGGGAGVVWQSDGTNTLIATCSHVVPRTSARVTRQGVVASATVIARDPTRDSALLRVDTAGFPAPNRPLADESRAGQLVAAVGHPLGVRDTIVIGVVHSVDRLGGDGPTRWIRADVRLQPGNSGGPLLDAHGRILGLCALIARGLAHAVPVSAFTLLEHQYRNGPALDARLRPVALGGTRSSFGMLVLDVTDDGPADRAGLLAGDVLTGADGRPFQSPTDLAVALTALTVQNVVVLDAQRARSALRFPVRFDREVGEAA